MIRLIFNSKAIPRTTTRDEWRKIYRWRRVTERELREAMQMKLENVAIYGTSHPEILRDFIDRAVNPPVMFYPPLEPEHFSVGPGRVQGNGQ